MVLPELDVARVQRWCDQRAPHHHRDKLRVECQASPRALTIVERRPPWRGDAGAEWTSLPVARLRYTQADQTWALYWCDQHSRFHRYHDRPPTSQVRELLREIEDDPAALFWG